MDSEQGITVNACTMLVYHASAVFHPTTFTYSSTMNEDCAEEVLYFFF